MNRRRRPYLCARLLPCPLALVLALALPLAAQKGVAHARLGLELVPPKGWIELPPAGERGQLELFFAAPRGLAGRTEGSVHTPVLKVLFLRKGGTDQGDVVDGLPRRTPFRDLDDWVRRGHGDRARIGSRESGKHGDFGGQRFTAKVEDAAGDRTLYGVAIPFADEGELLVVFDLLADRFEKERKELDRTLEGLRKTAAKADAEPRVEPPWRADPAAFAKLDAAAQARARREFAAGAVAAARKSPGLGWKEVEHRTWTVLSAADAAATSRAIAAAEAARAWCEAELPQLGGEPLPAVLRVFATPDQYNALKLGDRDQREYSAARRELYFHPDPDAGSKGGYGMLLRAVLWQHLDDADPGILPAMPRWLDNGLWEYLRSTRMKGKQIEFFASDVERGRIDYQQRAKSMPALWHLMQESMQPSPADGASEDPWGYTPECARLVRWLCEHDGGAAFGKPDLLAAYCKGLGAAYRSVGPDPTRDVDTARLDEAQTKVANQRYYTWRDAVLVACNNAVVPLQEEAWRAANAKWLEFNVDMK